MRSKAIRWSLAMVVTLAACGGDGDTAGSTVESYPANGLTDSVLAIDNNFLPQTLTVVAGTEVVFENAGHNPHNVVPADDPIATEWGVLDAHFLPDATYSHVFATPGTYTFYCTIHGSAKAGMVGTIEVTAP